MRNLLIVNPHARQVAAHPGLPADIQACLASHGVRTQLHLTRSAADAAETAGVAAREGCSMVIAAGGDGTINEVVNGLAMSDTAVGVVPLGTGNVFGHYLKLKPGDIDGACELIGRGLRRRIDLGCMNGRYFVNMAGVGLDAQVALDVVDFWKSLVGTYAFVAQFMATGATVEPWQFEASIDGKEIGGRMWMLFACNTSLYTWRVQLVPDADECDGQLDFVVFRACARDALYRQVADLFVNHKSAADCEDMQVIRGRQLRASARPPAPWQVEGEVVDTTPIECRVQPGALLAMSR